jgi:protein SCO1/2
MALVEIEEPEKTNGWFQRPLYKKIMLGFGLVLLIAATVSWVLPWLQPYTYHGTVLQASAVAQDFTLDTSAGKPMSLSDFRGKYLLIYFGYTFCPDVCPLTLSDLKTAVATLGADAERVQVLFISVDPARDTVAQLASYLPHFNPTFLGMTGDSETILQAATQFGIFYDSQQSTSTAYYTVDHTSTVVVVDPEGYVRLVFPYSITGAEMAADLRHLMQ